MITFGTVLFYVGQEILSITENLAQVGVKVPQKIKNSLQVIEEKSEDVDK
ncbi:putative holin; skin element (fragment) [Bacillus sp. 349Y]